MIFLLRDLKEREKIMRHLSFCRDHYPIQELIRDNFDPSTLIIDIGAGQGAYRKLFPEYCMDGIEICDLYIKDFKLRELYREVFCCDAVDFSYSRKNYELAILGDVLEHMTVQNAKDLLLKLKNEEISMVFQIPYMAVKGINSGWGSRENVYEYHIQDDLTHEIFMERYKEFDLKLLRKNQWCGIYYIFYNKENVIIRPQPYGRY